ncbi:hypothetical protein OV203_34725 [Nannocystis sp. ILAH1]|uniref:hypothetical protein n=1 Tax=Nannocystis sp. ILAH1 TaxID=2996789 RepID=UPI00226D60C5|nr:hypothetical protein [Nannocystis sp. ILAH1]MCY0992345.1 hypothetical protein [Nannocystis sp. ILAH1]
MSLLLRHLEANGPLSRADLEAATRRQQLAGGSLDTAILELGLMTPLQLDALLQSACGLPGAPVRLLERGPTRPWEHVPRDLVDIGWAMPLAQEDGRLIVAVHPDLPDAKLGQLYRMVRGFYPVVAPECCLAKIAAERTASILAPRYALILLDYLEALRTASITISLMPGAAEPRPSEAAGPADSRAEDAPVPTDRQTTEVRAEAAVPGDRPTSEAREGAPVPADRQPADARGADAAVPADRSHADARPEPSGADTPVDARIADAPSAGDRQATSSDPSQGSDTPARRTEAPTATHGLEVEAGGPALDSSRTGGSASDQVAAAHVEAPVPADRSAIDAKVDGTEARPAAAPRADAADATQTAPVAADGTTAGVRPVSLADALLADVPVPSDRQMAGPRPAAMSGPNTAARATGSPSGAPPPSETGSPRTGTPDDAAATAPVPGDRPGDSPAPALKDSRNEAIDADRARPANGSTLTAGSSPAAPTLADSPTSDSDARAHAPRTSDELAADRAAAATSSSATTPAATPVPQDSRAAASTPPSVTAPSAPVPADSSASNASAPPSGREPARDAAPVSETRSPQLDTPSHAAAGRRTETAPTPAAAASRQTAAYDSRAPEPDPAPAANRPPSTRPSPVPVAPDAPLIDPGGFEDENASLAAMAIAPDTPLIILPPATTPRPVTPALGVPIYSDTSSGNWDRRTLVGIPVGVAPAPAPAPDKPAAAHGPSNGVARPTAASSPPVPSASPAEPAPSPPVPSASPAEPAPSPPVSSTSSSEAAPSAPEAASDEDLVESSTRKPPALPQPMVMTLAQRLDAARATLATARERDRITEALVRAASLIAPRVALFGVKREGLRVLAAPGSALRMSEGLVIPLPEGGLLDRAVSGQGPLHLLIEPSLSFAVGQPLGIPCIFEPVLAGGRTVLMLYLDRSGVAFDPRERTVLRELCDTARQSLEALLRLLGWVVPGGTPGAGPADRTRPSIRPATPIVTVDEADAPATTPPVSADSSETEPPSGETSAEPDDSEPPPTASGAASEPGFGDSNSLASRLRSRGNRGRAVITLKNPIRRDDPATVTPLPVRAESSALVRAQTLADEPPPPPVDEPEYEDLTDDPEELDSPPPRRDGPGLGLAPVPVPLGPENGQDSPLVARFAAMFTKPPLPAVTIDLSDRPNTFGHARSDSPEAPPASPQPEMPGWIATAEPSGIEDPLPVAAALRSAATAAEARVDHDPAATLPGAPRVMLEETTRASTRDEFDEWPRAASDTPTILDLSPPPTHEPLLVETRAAPDAKTVLDLPRVDSPVPPETLIPNLVAPPGTPRAGRRRRANEAAEDEPVLVIPKTLRRSGGLTATPHPMARRSDPDELEGGPTLTMPTTLIGPRSGRRRGKHDPRPDSSSSALTMPRLVREAEADDAAAQSTANGIAPSEHAPEDMSPATGSKAQVDASASPAGAAEASGSVAAPPADERPAADELSSEEPAAAADAAPGAALDDREIDAVIEGFLQNPAEWTSVSRLRALDERGLARLAARFPGPIDLANATNFPPPSAHGPLLRACVELGHAVSPHVLALFASARPQIRFYAAFLFQELRDPKCLRPLGELAFDSDPDVRLIATRVLESYSRVPDFATVAAEIRGELESSDRDRQLLAVEAAGTLRDTLAVPRLIDLLAVRDKHVREAALEALCSITAKHHGYRAQRWRAWYAEHGQEPRIEWVIDGLRHRDEAVRRWAADELARITGQRIPFPAEGDRRSRELALRAWQAWWDSNREDFTAGS